MQPKLRPETKKIILNALSEELKAAGLPSLEEAREQMEAMLKRTDQHQVEEFASSGLGMGLAWTPLAMLEKQMDEWDEPTPKELDAILKTFKGIRYEIRGILNEATKKLFKTLLRRVGGRPRKLEPDQYADVCQEIANLLAKRVPLRVAFRRVGAMHNASARTIQRIWQKRPPE
jgi:hypothetical protein